MTKITVKQKNINRILHKLERLDFFDDAGIPEVKSYLMLKEEMLSIMDGSEEDAMKGLDMILEEPQLRKRFTNKEINEYIWYAKRNYNRPPKYNTLYKILKKHKYTGINYKDNF